MSVRPLAAAVLISVTLAGCLQLGPSNDGPVLADFAGCNVTYPNGTPADCEMRELRASLEGPPSDEDWVCMAEGNLSRQPYDWQYWENRQGHVGVQYRYLLDTDIPEVDGPVAFGVLHVFDGQQEMTPQHVLFRADAEGFVSVRADPQGEAQVVLTLWRFGADGEPGVLDTEHMTSQARLIEAPPSVRPWFVWSFSDGDATYRFDMPNEMFWSNESYSDGNDESAEYEGRDFRLDIASANPNHGFRLGPYNEIDYRMAELQEGCG